MSAIGGKADIDYRSSTDSIYEYTYLNKAAGREPFEDRRPQARFFAAQDQKAPLASRSEQRIIGLRVSTPNGRVWLII